MCELKRVMFLNPGQKWVEESFVTNNKKKQDFKYIEQISSGLFIKQLLFSSS